MDAIDLVNAASDIQPEYVDEQDPTLRTGWVIETVEGADRALRRMGECQIEASEVDRMEAAAIKEIKARAEHLRQQARRGVSFFEGLLLAWMEANRSTIVRGKSKSRDLLHGRVGWRASQERLKIVNEDKAQAWIDALPEGSPFYRVSARKPDMDAIQQAFATHGTIPDGFDVKAAEDKPYVKPEVPSVALVKE